MKRNVLIGVPLGIAFLGLVLAVTAPNGLPGLVLGVLGLSAAQIARERCPRGQMEQIEYLFRKIRRRERLRRLVGNIRGR